MAAAIATKNSARLDPAHTRLAVEALVWEGLMSRRRLHRRLRSR